MKLHFLNIENYEFIEMWFKTRFHYTLTNKKTNKQLFVTFVGIANCVNLREKGNLGKFINDEDKAKYSTTLQKNFYLEDNHELLNQISSKFYVGREYTWTNNWKLDNVLMISKKILMLSFDVEKNESGPSLKF
jgi:hypothetical protein